MMTVRLVFYQRGLHAIPRVNYEARRMHKKVYDYKYDVGFDPST